VIEFVPFERNRQKRYTLQINKDDVWNTLDFLFKEGTLKVSGMDFGVFEKMRRDMLSGKKISVNFKSISVREALANLAFLSGRRFHVTSGDPNQLVSISVKDFTLDEVVSDIVTRTRVAIKNTVP